MHKNVDVRKDHDLSMTSSNSQDRLRSIPGSTPPEALDVGNCTCSDRLPLASARMTAKPSSTREVKVRPSCAARFLARLRSSSFILTVVLIHQSISPVHQYVKLPTSQATILNCGYLSGIFLWSTRLSFFSGRLMNLSVSSRRRPAASDCLSV
jgi:hypothetical protein